jgi:Uma2 family endonuclease
MSAVPRHPDGHAGLRMTADEYLALGETQDRYELIDGVVVMSPSASDEHSEIAVSIAAQLSVFAHRTGSIRVFADIDTRFGPGIVYRPDVLVYLGTRLQGAVRRRDLAPDLVVEVLSPSNRGLDLVTKRRDYDRFGVGEYWIVDPEGGQIRVLQRRADGEPFVESLVSGDTLASVSLSGFVLDLKPVRAIMESARADSGE